MPNIRFVTSVHGALRNACNSQHLSTNLVSNGCGEVASHLLLEEAPGLLHVLHPVVAGNTHQLVHVELQATETHC